VIRDVANLLNARKTPRKLAHNPKGAREMTCYPIKRP
jgi:hypothetical protein